MNEIDSDGSIKQTTAVTVFVKNDADKHSIAQLLIVPLSLGGRLKLAFKTLAICWTIAFFLILIPVLHFVLVPGGILFGLILFQRKLSLCEILLYGSISCPNCTHEFDVEKGAFNWPKQENCPKCNAMLIVKESG